MADEDKYQKLAKEIFDHVGGTQNVDKLIHCMTRVRMTLKDEDKADIDGLKKVPGVLGVEQADTFQVILGPGVVNKVAQDMVDTVGVGLGEEFPTATMAQSSQYQSGKAAVEAKAAEVHAEHKAKQKKTWWRSALQHISGIFIPLIPAFVGAGLISGIAGILSNMMTVGTIGPEWGQFILVLKVINGGLFTYLNIYVGINAANEFGATPGLGGIIGGLVLLPGVDITNKALTITNIFTHQPLVAGSGGIIGVLFAVWILSYVEKFFHKYIPDSVDIIFTPFLTLLIMGVFTIFLVMPAAGWVSDSLVGGINWVLKIGGAFSGFVLGLVFLPMVMLGLHQILTPIHLAMIKSLGYTPLLPILAMAGGGQVGAAIALWIRCHKNKQLTNMIKGALPVGILGVGEPLIYGVSLPLGRPFITACIGGGIGGAVIGGIGNIGAITIGPSGIALIPLIYNNHWLGYVLGLLAAYIGGFIVTFFFGVPKSAMVAKDENGTVLEGATATATTAAPADAAETAVQPGTSQFVATASGQLEHLDKVEDSVFSKKMVGDGYAIEPNMETIVAPVTGVIANIQATKHAFMLTTDSGLEVMVHMGLDTVEMNGAPFTLEMKAGQAVTAGQQIALMDIKAVEAAGKKPTVITVVTNMDHVASMGEFTDQTVNVGDDVLSVTSK